jgi:DNA-binding NarL/FixJ family response regulator
LEPGQKLKYAFRLEIIPDKRVKNKAKVKTNNKSIRVVVADDSKMMLETIVGLLTPHFEVVGTARDGKTALEIICELKPDIAVLDMSMPLKTGIEITAELKTIASDVKVVILSSRDDEYYIRAATSAGALAYVVKTTLADGLIPALERVYAGTKTSA